MTIWMKVTLDKYEIVGLNPVIKNGRLQMQIRLKDKVRFLIEMED